MTDYSEPVDVRKNRALTLENMKLSREVERLRGFQGDNEFLKKEVKSLKVKLEEEQKCRSKIQFDLEQYQASTGCPRNYNKFTDFHQEGMLFSL